MVYDITRPPTFKGVERWKYDIESKVFLDGDKPIPCVLLANKCDLADKINKSNDEMNEYCRENGFAGWFETSAKENTNIHEAVRFLVEKILENQNNMQDTEEHSEALNLEDVSDKNGKKKSGCC